MLLFPEEIGSHYLTIYDELKSAIRRCFRGRSEHHQTRSTPFERPNDVSSGSELVTTTLLLFEPGVERNLGEWRGSIKVDSPLPYAADPAPLAH